MYWGVKTKSKIANVIDLEFNDWEIIEIGLTTVNLEKKEILKTYSIPIKNNLNNPISPEIYQLTGWTDHKLQKQGIYLSEAIDRLINKYGSLGRITITDSNNEFDLMSLNIGSKLSSMSRFDDIEVFSNDRLCVSTLFKIKTGIFKPNYSLTGMLKCGGLDFEGTPHRGADDSRNIARLFLELIK